MLFGGLAQQKCCILPYRPTNKHLLSVKMCSPYLQFTKQRHLTRVAPSFAWDCIRCSRKHLQRWHKRLLSRSRSCHSYEELVSENWFMFPQTAVRQLRGEVCVCVCVCLLWDRKQRLVSCGPCVAAGRSAIWPTACCQVHWSPSRPEASARLPSCPPACLPAVQCSGPGVALGSGWSVFWKCCGVAWVGISQDYGFLGALGVN